MRYRASAISFIILSFPDFTEYMEHTSVVTVVVALGVANLKRQFSREGMYSNQ